LRFALLVVRPQPFLRIVALEKLLLQFALEGEGALEGDLPSGLHGALDAADRLGRFVRRTEAPRVLHDAVPPLLSVLLGGPQVVDDAEALRFLEVEQAAFDHQLDGLRFAHQAREPLRTAGSGEHAEGDLREADLPRALQRDADVRGHGDLQPPADRVAVHRRDDQLGSLFQPVQRLVGVETEVVLELRRDLREHFDVRAGGEEFLTCPAQDDDVHVVVHASLEDAGVELLVHLEGVGVRGGVVQLENRHPFVDSVVDEISSHVFLP